MLKFCIKDFEIPINNQRVCLVRLIFGMMINIGPKFILYHPNPCMWQTLNFVYVLYSFFTDLTSSKPFV